ncbi:Ras-related protein Rab-32 [Trichoplax sp. H2]|nr:Ras-related protein Rab-32 [Trichoplax sp. H2]|eukprot:RDD37592.1 Ras-related protein Rab-32 [Trichoplax sp. H2]
MQNNTLEKEDYLLKLSWLEMVYYREAVGAIGVYSVIEKKTFEITKRWKTDIDSKVSLPDGSSIPAILLANKVTINRQCLYDLISL